MKYIYRRLMDLFLRLYILFGSKPLKMEYNELKGHQLNSILVFSNTALGDTLLSTPAIKSLKDSFPNARITLFIHKNIYPLLEGVEYIDNFVIYHGGYKKFFATVMQLRHLKADAALMLHSNGPQDIPMAIMSGAKILLKTPTKSSYKHYLSYEFTKKEQHTIEDRLDLVKGLGGDKTTIRMTLPKRYYEDKGRNILPPDAVVIGFQPGAANIYKMWPVESFKELASRLLTEYPNVIIAVTGSKKEGKLGEAIKDVNPQRIQNFCGKFPIENLPNLINEMDVLVTNDTGTMHIAIALGIHTVELFSGSESKDTGAYQDLDRHTIIQKDGSYIRDGGAKKHRSDDAMRLIGVDEVFDTLNSFIKSAS